MELLGSREWFYLFLVWTLVIDGIGVGVGFVGQNWICVEFVLACLVAFLSFWFGKRVLVWDCWGACMCCGWDGGRHTHR